MPSDSIGIASTSQSDAQIASHRIGVARRDAMLMLPALVECSNTRQHRKCQRNQAPR
jgi:hypothetical protein